MAKEVRDQEGKWKKGRSGNPSGRPINPARQAIKKGLAEMVPQLLDEIRKLEGKDMVDAWSKVAPYAFPKLSNIDLSGENENNSVKINIEYVNPKDS